MSNFEQDLKKVLLEQRIKDAQKAKIIQEAVESLEEGEHEYYDSGYGRQKSLTPEEGKKLLDHKPGYKKISKDEYDNHVKKHKSVSGPNFGGARALSYVKDNTGSVIHHTQTYSHDSHNLKPVIAVNHDKLKKTSYFIKEDVTEESKEQLDEISKKTLGSYVKKAVDKLTKESVELSPEDIEFLSKMESDLNIS